MREGEVGLRLLYAGEELSVKHGKPRVGNLSRVTQSRSQILDAAWIATSKGVEYGRGILRGSDTINERDDIGVQLNLKE